MNSDFVQSVLVKLIIAAGSAWAAKHAYAIDGSALQMFAGGLAAAGAAGWRIYQGYATKKVPETAIAINPAVPNPAQVGDRATVSGKVVG